MKQLHTSRVFVTALLAVFCAIWFWSLGTRALSPADEGPQAQMARDMLDGPARGWIAPRPDGAPQPGQAPLQAWAGAVGMSFLGQGAWQARLWSGACGLFGIWLVAHAGRRVFNAATGFIAATVLATCGGWIAFGHLASPDMGLAAMTTVTLCGLLMGQRDQASPRQRRKAMLASWAGMALAVLSGGPAGALLPAAALLLYMLLARDWTVWKRLWFGPGILLFLAICAPWFILAWRTDPQFPPAFFNWEQLRMLVGATGGTVPDVRPGTFAGATVGVSVAAFGGADAIAGAVADSFGATVIALVGATIGGISAALHSGVGAGVPGGVAGQPWLPWLLPLAVPAAGFLPWLGILPQSLWAARNSDGGGFRPKLLLLTWIGSIVVFSFMTPSGPASVLLPAVPALALLAGSYLESAPRRAPCLAAGLTVLSCLAMLPFIGRLGAAGADDFSRQSMENFQVWAYAAMSVLLLGALLALLLSRRRRQACILALGAGAFAATILLLCGQAPASRQSAGVDLLTAIEAELGPRTPLYAVGRREGSLPFYLGRGITQVASGNEGETGPAPDTASPAADTAAPARPAFLQRWIADSAAGRKSVAILSPAVYHSFSEAAVPMRLLARDGLRVVVTNDPVAQ